MKKVLLASLVLGLLVVQVVACRNNDINPEPPPNIAEVPSPLEGEEFVLTWQAPGDWGPGVNRRYRVEFYDGEKWVYLDTVTGTQYTFEVPFGVSINNARLSVRAETSQGHSTWKITNMFAIKTAIEITEVSVSTEEYSLGHPGGSFLVQVEVEPPDATNMTIAWEADVPWIIVPEYSEAGAEVEVVVEENTSQEQRVGTITVTAASGVYALIEVAQDGHVVPVTSVAVDPGSLSVEYGPGTYSATATVLPADATNKAISWSADVNWITLPATSQSGDEISIVVAENTTTSSRTGAVTVTAGNGQRATITVTQAGRVAPGSPQDASSISSPVSHGEVAFSWSVPGNWGSGDNLAYRVEFFNGNSWVLVGTTQETDIVYSVPDSVYTTSARFRVRAQTTHGNSSFVQSNAFAVGPENQYYNSEPGFSEEELTVTAHHVYYRDDNLVFIAWLVNGYEQALEIDDIALLIGSDNGEVAYANFDPFDGPVIEPGEALLWEFIIGPGDISHGSADLGTISWQHFPNYSLVD